MQERKHVVPGSPFQKWEYRQVAMGSGSHIHVEVVTEEITFPVGIPAPVAVRLRIAPLAVTVMAILFPAFAGALFTLLSCGADRGTVTGKCQMFRINQPFRYGVGKELLIIKPENEMKRIILFKVPAFQESCPLSSCP